MSMPSGNEFAQARRAVGIEAADDLLLAELQDRMGLGAGRLDHFDRRGQHRKPGLLRLQARIVAEQVLRPHAEHHLAVRGASDAGVCGKRQRRGLAVAKRNRDRWTAVELREFAGNEIHRRRAHEAGDEHVGGPVVDGLRLVELLDRALVHDGDAGGERHRLDLVVGDVDRGLADPLMELLDLGAHVDAQLGVEIGQRLVEQEELRIAHQRAPHGDALALAAGQLAGLAVEQRLDLQQRGDARDRGVLLGLGHAAALHAEGHVLARRHRRVERVGLEHHGDVAILRRDRIDERSVDADLALADAFQAGDHGEQRRLAAAGRSDERDELARLRLEIDALENLDRAEALGEPRDGQRRHDRSGHLMAPWVSPRTKYLPPKR